MRKSRFTEEQIVAILKEAGRAVAELCRQHGMAHRAQSSTGGEPSAVGWAFRLKQVEDESP